MIFQTPELGHAEIALLDEISTLRGSAGRYLAATHTWNRSLRRLTNARNLQGSNAIEGYHSSVDDALAIADGDLPQDADGATAAALAGYQSAMTYVLTRSVDPDFTYTTDTFKALHFMLIQHDRAALPGRWRSTSVFVRAASGEAVYEGAELARVDDLVTELADELTGTESASSASSRVSALHSEPLVAAAMAHLNLVMIHPFGDGNGRMSRILQSLVLARAAARAGEVLAPEYLSIEEYLGANTEDYYQVLAETGGGRYLPGRNPLPWVRFALTAHRDSMRQLLVNVQVSEQLWSALGELPGINGSDRLTTALYDASFGGHRLRRSSHVRSVLNTTGEAIGEQTATRDLTSLAELGFLVPHGERRARFYVVSGQLTQIYLRIRNRVTEQLDHPPTPQA
ncbi:MAG: Fic family protein [Actinomycetota bacterium]|nr:Fic family protein [Actinomycetota bacterium]